METAHKILEAKSTEFGPLGREQIKQLCEAGLIKPFVAKKIREKDGKPTPSYGLSEAGYDIRLGYSFLVPHGAMDVANPHYDGIVLEDDDTLWLDGNSFVLGESVETFDLPPDIRITAFSKSTWLRAGIVVPISPLEPGWKGKLSLEIFNAGKNRAKLYPGVGIAQLVFELIPVGAGYKGPYQLQAGVTGSLLRPDRWD